MATPLATAEKLEFLRQELPPEAGARLWRASDLAPSAADGRGPLATGLAALDRLLLGGLPRGGIVELTGRRSSGRFAAVLTALAAATRAGESAVLADMGDGLCPADAERAGADLSRLLWLRPRRLKEALAAAEAALSAGFALVVVDLGPPPLSRAGVPATAWPRLARQVRARGAAFLLCAPWPVGGSSVQAAVSARRARSLWEGSGAAPRLLSGIAASFLLEKIRGSSPGRSETARLRAF
jgi:hypothetical protein